jgi:two-component system chemotaxis response regulator CheB
MPVAGGRKTRETSVAGHDIIVIGASAGGVEALVQLVRGLPADLPAALFVVLHTPSTGTSALPNILGRAGPFEAVHPKDGSPIETGQIYVAPPDHHLLVKHGYVRVTAGPREHGSRPAVDPLFRTAALAYGRRVIGVVLSGNLDDGTIGLAAIKARGGLAVVQDPDDALYPGMPESAIQHVLVDHVVTIADMPPLLERLARTPIPPQGADLVSEEMEIEADIAELDPAALNGADRPGNPSGFGCPECGGALFVLSTGDLIHFRCRVGHAWSPDSLLAQQDHQLETALWTALRALEENAALSLQLASRFRERGSITSAARFEERAIEARRNAEVVRRVLLHGTPGTATEPETTNEATREISEADTRGIA